MPTTTPPRRSNRKPKPVTRYDGLFTGSRSEGSRIVAEVSDKTCSLVLAFLSFEARKSGEEPTFIDLVDKVWKAFEAGSNTNRLQSRLESVQELVAHWKGRWSQSRGGDPLGDAINTVLDNRARGIKLTGLDENVGQRGSDGQSDADGYIFELLTGPLGKKLQKIIWDIVEAGSKNTGASLTSMDNQAQRIGLTIKDITLAYTSGVELESPGLPDCNPKITSISLEDLRHRMIWAQSGERKDE
ncbi:hypothetical protein TREMEDRAFT_58640 [Tremella mesenterica DSM 1558]|uniref:uncharacterized protein n=1 Tax=Tremella mesenterica (strain ATCC 24925 / CBS 8224 / DSM 1558 / NBRC 9311 / NRRL Y-6157 / RJB 2259-6 / UBC 559-6) TaxID=578456 RepID=UPI0003F48C71|nr:uncharacterized protein TREMEDRAFT_58640 [Tremella mesenterica DSM 1558]EIW72471.1 hypothetical protein TREMEDRAFT_58640 [Tremella mesenterica DSM 1558]